MVRKERVCEKENVAFLNSISLLIIFPNNNRLLPIDLEFLEFKESKNNFGIQFYFHVCEKKEVEESRL